MNLDLGQAFDRAQTVVNGLVAAIPSVVVALVVFGAFLVVAAIVKGVVARLTEARLRAHRNAGVPVGRLAQGLVILLGLLVALSVALPTFRPGTSADPWHRERRHRVCVPDILQNFLAGILLLITSRFASAIRLWPALRRHGRGHSDPRDVHPHLRWPTRRGPQRQLFTDTVVVNTAFEHRPLEYDVGIGYGDDIDRARGLILEAVRGTGRSPRGARA